MSRNARLWIGITLLIIIVFNYAAIGIPLAKKSASIQEKSKAILIKQVKSGEVLKNSEDEYILNIFRKEKTSIDQKMLILNTAAISFTIIVLSWTAFGLITAKRK